MERLVELTTPRGKELLFREMHAREELGRLSEFDVSALSTNPDIKPSDLLAKSVTVKLQLRDGGSRYFNGYVSRFAQGGMVGRYYVYRMTVRPGLWFLTRTTDCKIFQDKTAKDIIKEVLADHASLVTVDDGDLSAPYRQREYCVQYRETDFDFVSRLMEEEGIYYYFVHQDGQHTLKLVDASSAHKALDHRATIPFHEHGINARIDEEYVSAWTFVQAVQPGTVTLEDYDFTKPKADLTVKSKNIENHAHSDYEVYDYPGEYLEANHGDHYARARIDEFHAEFEQADALCNVREIAVGRTFTLTKAPRRDQEREYLIVGSEHHIRDNAYEASPTDTLDYDCRMTVLQTRQQFRPARLTPRPIVKGPQTAVVVGPSGEEIYCDKYGRVKVQFHWDRYGKKNENSSCWIRVSSPWAGANWGGIAMPRIGQEVIVDFLEGDPDQPIITGRVYNADQMPPYALPANATQTGIKSRSSKGGGAANFNEIRFEDKKGSEQVFLHAEKNQDIEVENDETHWVGHDRSKTIDHDETTHVKHDRTETVDNNETITVHANRTEMVDQNETITIGMDRTRTVQQNEIVTVALTRTHTIGVNEAITVGAAQEITVGASQVNTIGVNRMITVGVDQEERFGNDLTTNVGSDRTTTIGDNCTTDVGKDQKLTVGKNLTTDVGDNENRNVGKKLHIDVGDEVVISCGSSVITMKKDGTINIEGTKITIDATQKIDEKAMNITSEASTKHITKGAMVNVEASGINTIKGSLVKIN